jgi:hypothetical protein
MFGSLQFALDESLVDYDFRRDIGEFASLPCLDLLSHRLKVALHSIDANRDAVDERKRLRVFRQYGRKHCCNAKGNFQFERTVRYRQQ